MDVWNIFDFLQPGALLGSAREFTEKYERPIVLNADLGSTEPLSNLRSRLRYGSRNAFVLRRDKKTLPGLPKKHEHILECVLSPAQREWHLDIVARAHEGGANNHPFSLLQQLMLVYQHPSLVPRYEAPLPRDAVDQCDKLAKTIDCIRKIKASREKVLLFTRSCNMQDLLKKVIDAEFGLDLDIVNGQVARQGSTKGLRNTRREILERFRNTAGFNAIILSPEVAGVGLTLVEANHVIHYGRWWNPAKESQATDRVYRIRQTRDVHVYYPIAKDPKGAFESFDEKLDALIKRRLDLASEFLAPMPPEDELEKELFGQIADSPPSSERIATLGQDDVRLLPWDRFESLIALLEVKRGGRVVLTPRGGDDKADVVSIQANQIRLIQCKHSFWSALVDSDVVTEVLGAMDLYRVRYLRNLPAKMSIFPVIVSNGTFTSRAISEARHYEIELIGDLELWKLLGQMPCTRAELEVMESSRCQSMRDVQASLRQMLSS